MEIVATTATTVATVATDEPPEITLTKRELWIDNQVLHEYIPDRVLFEATLLCPRLEERAAAHIERMRKSGRPAPATVKDALEQYYMRVDKKTHAKKCEMGRAKHGFGRAFVRDGKSFADMERYTRNTLTKDFYTDFDLKNAQLEIINQLLTLNGYTRHKGLKFYCEKRDDCLKKWMTTFKIGRDEAKNLATQVIFGAQKIPGGFYDELLVEMFQERDEWGRFLREKNPKLYESARQANMLKEKRSEGQHLNTMIAWIGQEYECRIVSACLEFCDEVGLLFVEGCSNLKIASYIYDGFMLWKENVLRYGARRLLCEFGEVGYNATGLMLDWDVKEHQDECYDVSEGYMDIMARPKSEALDPNLTFEEYSAIWEKTHAKIIKGGLYVETTPEGFKIRTKGELTEAFEHLWCGYTEGKNPKRQNWIKLWTQENDKIKSYDRMDTYPDVETCPANVLNLWVPYEMEKVKYVSPRPDAIDFIAKHILDVICDGGVPQAKYMLDWISHIVKYPDTKTKKCPIILSKQEGTGKSSLIRLLERMLGKDKVWEPQKPERDVWGSFNGNLIGKTIVVLNEISGYQAKEGSMGEIKALITETKVSIRAMRQEAQEMSDYTNYIATTNDETGGFKIGEDTRRFWMLRASDIRLGDTEYFDRFYGYLADDNCVKSVYEWFKGRDVVKGMFNDPKATPITQYQMRIADNNRSTVETFMEHLVRENWELPTEGNRDLDMSATEVLTLYKRYCEEQGCYLEKGATTAAGLSLKINQHPIHDKAKAVKCEKRRDGSWRTFYIDKMLKYFKEKGTITDAEFERDGSEDPEELE